MEQQIYLLYSCDEWKSKSHLICATTSKSKLKDAIMRCIQSDDMTYSHGATNLSSDEQVELFCEDWQNDTPYNINSCLTYGFFETVSDGELF